ncbi:hypothetical protein SAMN05444972_10299 [Marininema halotolerans]|uniref:Uncharacterized protein n=1 Tax=Marininema halotolerans TaxID=1155944 RepID=A0A1I6PS91_9BACL|nr:hypothetical protein SAMN05444972_10299 [Marininema halotolerans]
MMMTQSNTGCPICNGFESLCASCPQCGDWYDDRGRYFDDFAAYSPYDSIDELKQAQPFSMNYLHLCPHHLYCSQCGSEEIRYIHEIYM